MRQRLRIGICITSLGASTDELTSFQDLATNIRQEVDIKIFGDIRQIDRFGSRPVRDRLDSFCRASRWADIVMAWNGGYNSIELLAEFDSLSLAPTTIFAGYSDNTILVNALPASGRGKGLMGPMAKNWQQRPDLIEMWLNNLDFILSENYVELTELYSEFEFTVLRPGRMRGPVWGGNNYTFDLLQGTKWAPSLNKPFILLLEGEDFIKDCSKVWPDFIRNLDSIMLQEGAQENLQGLLLGRFPESYQLDSQDIMTSVADRPYLQQIPIVYDLPRGYTAKSLYLPVGEPLDIELFKDNRLTINKL